MVKSQKLQKSQVNKKAKVVKGNKDNNDSLSENAKTEVKEYHSCNKVFKGEEPGELANPWSSDHGEERKKITKQSENNVKEPTEKKLNSIDRKNEKAEAENEESGDSFDEEGEKGKKQSDNSKGKILNFNKNVTIADLKSKLTIVTGGSSDNMKVTCLTRMTGWCAAWTVIPDS